MHIGFLSPEYVMQNRLDGGLANSIRKVGLALVKRGHAVSVFVLSDRTGCWQDMSITVHEVKRFTWPDRLTATRSHYLRALLPVTAQIISARQLRKVVWRRHVHTPIDVLQTSSYGAPGFALRHNGRIPMVCRVSSYTPLVRSAYGRPRSLGEYLSDWLEIRQVLDADGAFAPSHFAADAYARTEGFRPQIIRTPVDKHDPPMDSSYYQEQLAGLSYLLFFGTLSRIKGVDLLADVIPSILGRHEHLSLVFIGRDDRLPGGEKVFDYLCSQCQPYSRRLHYHAALPQAQLYPIIAHALAVLMPSRVDNYPNACLEAHAMGVPVIGTYDSSLEEMIVEGQTGFLARNGAPTSISDAVERALSLSPSERQQMKRQILASIQSIRAEDRVGQLMAFYEAILDRFHGGG